MATASLKNEISDKIQIFMYSTTDKEVSDVLQKPDAPPTTDENGYIGIECAICYKRINISLIIVVQHFGQLSVQLIGNRLGSRIIAAKRIKPFVIPSIQAVLFSIFQVRDMYLNNMFLTDTIKSAYALLQ